MFPLAPLPRTVDAALRDAGHAKLAVRLSALADLGRFASGPDAERAITEITRLLAHDPSSEVRAGAALALADAKAGGAGRSLLAATKDPDQKVRQMALLALGELGSDDRDHLETIRSALDDPAAALRFQALVALHHLGGTDIESDIEAKFEDTDAEVRFVAIRIAEERFIEDHRGRPAWLVDKLKQAVSDDVTFVRLLAAIVLYRAGEDTDAGVLADAVNARIGVREVEDEQEAIEIAGELRLEQARAGLERRAFGWFGISRDPFAWQARVALAKMGHVRAVASILADLKGWTWETRTLAAAAAGASRLRAARAGLLAMLGDETRANPDTVRDALRQIDASSAG
ncbi:MAG TPA: HEAT repeat domain-containing protein [Polyangiaceae bacterium]